MVGLLHLPGIEGGLRLAKWGFAGLSAGILGLILAYYGPRCQSKSALNVLVLLFAAWILIPPLLVGTLDAMRIASTISWLVGLSTAIIISYLAQNSPKVISHYVSWLIFVSVWAALMVLAPKFGILYDSTVKTYALRPEMRLTA